MKRSSLAAGTKVSVITLLLGPLQLMLCVVSSFASRALLLLL
jgi:hypothetical protein